VAARKKPTAPLFRLRFAAALKRSGIPQCTFAPLLGYHFTMATHWLTGHSEPNLGTLLGMCRLLSVSPDWLLGFAPTEPFSRVATPHLAPPPPPAMRLAGRAIRHDADTRKEAVNGRSH
jgi:transcriptional regulator with XRE-family HTH domain